MAAILTYHHIAELPSSGEKHGLFVSPGLFARQLAYLHAKGYSVVTLDALRDELLGLTRLPTRSLVITFDDGSADNCCNALPVLRQYGFPATVFVAAGRIGMVRSKPGWPEPAQRYLSADEIAEMSRQGIIFGSHTMSHVRLSKIETERCMTELNESKNALEQLTGQSVRWLCYPYGSFSPRVIEMAKRVGYVGAVSTIRDNRPRRDKLYFLPRIMVMPDADERRFAYYLSPLYHWVHWFKNRRRWWKLRQWGEM